MHPPCSAHHEGLLDVGDGHALHFSVAGHPGAPVALFLHGGPGAGCRDDDRRWFDARRWRIVLVDQRGCGLSRTAAPLRANTTAHLVADLERLRRHLDIERWLLFGGSWGSTLALAYAQRHRERVSALVLHGVFLGTAAESAALYGPQAARWLDELQARVADGDADAARAWWRHEQKLIDAEEGTPPAAEPAVEALLAQARVGLHYARAGWWLREGELLAGAARLAGLPGVIVQGGRDRVTPPAAARALHAAWPGSQLHIEPQAGHASRHPALARRLVEAVEALAPRTEETNDER